MAQGRAVGLKMAALLIPLMVSAGSCKREIPERSGGLGASLIFDNDSPDVREALASPVDFIINDDNFARWEKAQRNFERLPRSAIPAGPAAGRTAVDRAVARLESSPYARTAIERTGLSVREFVLETIALAQATEAARTGKSIANGAIPPENFHFVQRYSARVLYSGSRVGRAEPRVYEWDSAAQRSDQIHTDRQVRDEESEQESEIRLAEEEMRREQTERATENQRAELERQREELEAQRQEQDTRQELEKQREEMDRQREQTQRARDSVREPAKDTLPRLPR